MAYRNANAETIAACVADRLVIVAGPGSGKTHLFLARIRYWLGLGGTAPVYVATFVRKLVSDLKAEIAAKLPIEQQAMVDASTLHALARSLIERNHGTVANLMGSFVRVIDRVWTGVVWDDVLAFHPELQDGQRPYDDLARQLHTGQVDSDEWATLQAAYRRLCTFYNAVGYDYMIVLGTEALIENRSLNEHRLWIIDEYQDFNPSEDRLVAELTAAAVGVLLAGDDDQALYGFKHATPDIIVGHYGDDGCAKAMLPYCSRCSYFTCSAASTFIGRHRAQTAIDKIYLPLLVDETAARVRIVATATPQGATDYVRRFIDDHSDDYASYLERRSGGGDTDPFLLVLSQSTALTTNGGPLDDLAELVASHADDAATASSAYQRVATYFAAALHPHDNYALRKVLHLERWTIDEVHDLIVEAVARDTTLYGVLSEYAHGVLDRVKAVDDLVGQAQLDTASAAQGLSDLLGLTDPAALAVELAEHPIGHDVREREDENAVEQAASLPPIALSTMVGSKGLSAHHVIIVGCDDVNMGHTDALAFYVGMTRARSSLHLIVSARTSGSSRPHPFLADLPGHACEYFNSSSGLGAPTAAIESVIRARRGLDDDVAPTNEVRRFDTVAQPLVDWLEEQADHDKTFREDVEAERERWEELIGAARQECETQGDLLDRYRDMVEQQIEATLGQVSARYGELDNAANGYGAQLRWRSIRPEHPTDLWMWEVTPEWRRGHGAKWLAYTRQANSAMQKQHRTHLVLAALLAAQDPAGRVLIVDEAGNDFGREHLRQVLSAFGHVADTHGVTVIAACQDKVLEEVAALGAARLLLWFERLSDLSPLCRATRVWGFDTDGRRVELTQSAMEAGRLL